MIWSFLRKFIKEKSNFKKKKSSHQKSSIFNLHRVFFVFGVKSAPCTFKEFFFIRQIITGITQ